MDLDRDEYSVGEAAKLLNVSVTYLVKTLIQGKHANSDEGIEQMIRVDVLREIAVSLESQQRSAIDRMYEISAKHESDE